jgi:hypothetical protein
LKEKGDRYEKKHKKYGSNWFDDWFVDIR